MVFNIIIWTSICFLDIKVQIRLEHYVKNQSKGNILPIRPNTPFIILLLTLVVDHIVSQRYADTIVFSQKISQKWGPTPKLLSKSKRVGGGHCSICPTVYYQCCSCLFVSGRTVVYRGQYKRPQFPLKIDFGSPNYNLQRLLMRLILTSPAGLC